MKWLLSLIIFSITFRSAAQEYLYPILPGSGNSIQAFLPSGFIIMDSVAGDLNSDSRHDIALVFQSADSVLIKSPYDSSENLLTKARILVVLIFDPGINKYILHDQHNSFILSHYDTNMDDPFDDIRILNGCLVLNFSVFMHSGSWYKSTYQYEFKLMDDIFQLTSAIYSSLHRASGEMEEYEYDFINHSRIRRTGVSGEISTIHTRSKIIAGPLKRLDAMAAPMNWQVDEDVFL